jgi:hypothetical protein
MLICAEQLKAALLRIDTEQMRLGTFYIGFVFRRWESGGASARLSLADGARAGVYTGRVLARWLASSVLQRGSR